MALPISDTSVEKSLECVQQSVCAPRVWASPVVGGAAGNPGAHAALGILISACRHMSGSGGCGLRDGVFYSLGGLSISSDRAAVPFYDLSDSAQWFQLLHLLSLGFVCISCRSGACVGARLGLPVPPSVGAGSVSLQPSPWRGAGASWPGCRERPESRGPCFGHFFPHSTKMGFIATNDVFQVNWIV